MHLQVFDVRSPVVYLPYHAATLRAYAETRPLLRQSWEFAPPVWRLRDLDTMLDEVGEPDLLGLSVYVWNHRNSHRLARAVKERFPRCLVVFGGPHVPAGPSDYLQQHPWVDLLVHGEGEAAFAGILEEALAEAPDWERVPGLSYRRDGAQRFTAPGSRMELDFPGPYAAGLVDPFLEEARSAFPDAVLHGALETNRGCPYSCAFCDWGMNTMAKLRRFPDERVLGELDWMARHGIATVVMNDANFGILPRDVDFTRRVAELKREHGFPRSFLPLGFAKNNKDRAFEINRLLQENGLDAAGCNVNFSLQSMSQATLDAIDRQNIPLDNYRALSDRYAAEGYRLMPDLIFPLPGETLASFQEGYADLASWEHVDRVMVYPCAILPNAPMARPAYREKWGMRTRVTVLPAHAALQLEAEDAVPEEVETLVSTAHLTEEEAAEAHAYATLVDAMEFGGIGRDLRRAWPGSPGSFYTAALAALALLQPVLGRIRDRALQHPEEPMWMAVIETSDGQEGLAAQAVLYEALSDAPRLAAELRALLPPGEQGDDLVRYARDRWITPTYDPRVPAEFQYAYDWIAHLERGEPLVRRPLRVRYHPRPEWRDSPFLATSMAWWIHTVAGYGCIHGPQEREVLDDAPKQSPRREIPDFA